MLTWRTKDLGRNKILVGKMVKDVLDKLQMCTINVEHECEGPMYTYVSSLGCSVVDYIFLDSILLRKVRNVEVMDERPNNTAYHLPVKAEIVVNGSH